MIRRKPIPRLIDDLAAEHWLTRSRAAEALGCCGSAAAPAVSALRKALCDTHREVRRDVVLALGKIGPLAEPAVRDLVELVDDSQVAGAVRETLVKIGAPAVLALIDALADAQRSEFAQSVLAEIGLSAVDGLVHALETDNKPVRSHILQTLSRIAPDRADAIAALTAVANDAAMPGIDRFYAVHALEKIGPHATKDIDPAAIYREISPDR